MLKGKRTALFSLLLGVLGLLQGFAFALFIENPRIVGFLVSGIGLFTYILRMLTTPIYKDKE